MERTVWDVVHESQDAAREAEPRVLDEGVPQDGASDAEVAELLASAVTADAERAEQAERAERAGRRAGMGRVSRTVPRKAPGSPSTAVGSTAPLAVREWANVRVRLAPDTRARVEYWASRHDVSEQEYMAGAIEQRIARENADYDLPTAEQHRLTQLVDSQLSLVTRLDNFEEIFVSTMSSMMELARGDNMLRDEVDGDIG